MLSLQKYEISRNAVYSAALHSGRAKLGIQVHTKLLPVNTRIRKLINKTQENQQKTIYLPRIFSYIGVVAGGARRGLRGLQADPLHLTQFVLP
jgi:hypothetical protein